LEYPETGVAELSGATVYGSTVGVVDQGNHLIPEVSIEWGTPPELHWTLRRLILPRREMLRGQTLLLASTGGETYFHWMTDVLPRINLILRAGHQLAKFDHILVTGTKKPFQKETLLAAGIPLNRCRILGPKAKGYYCENLTLPSLPSTTGVVPSGTVDYLKKLFPVERPPAKRKIFVGRADAKHRILQHESEIRRQLVLRGFEAYECEGKSVAEQARLFQSAETIVAAHGAALTNLVFCEPGATVLELFSPKYVNPCYRDICIAANLRYAAVIGDGKDWEVVMEHDQPAAPISASAEAALQALAQNIAG
jgi:capsular polysaccharide biosynthesis protein